MQPIKTVYHLHVIRLVEKSQICFKTCTQQLRGDDEEILLIVVMKTLCMSFDSS